MKCLVIMPFRAEFDAVFATVRDAASSVGADESIDCYWLKDIHAAGRITDDIVLGLREAAFCVADLSGNNPNVMWETGFAMALGKPVILVGQSVDAIPFDLNNHRLVEYDPARLDSLRLRLMESMRQTIARFATSPLRPLPAHLYWLGHDLARAIRLAMDVSPNWIELEKNLLFALYHLERIELPAPDSRRLILQALRRCRLKSPLLSDEQQQLVGWIAQAKNDLGDQIAAQQGDFAPYPTADQRQRYLADAQ